MASLLKSIGNWLRGKKDDAAKQLADPVRDGKFAIEDSEKQIAMFTKKVAGLVAQNKRSQRQAKDAEAEVEKWQGIAAKAAESGSEEDARTALEKKAEAQERLTTLRSEEERNKKLIATLREQLNNARAKVAKAKSNHTRLSARMEGAKIRQDLAKASSTFSTGGDSPLSQLDDLSKSVEEKETEAEAYEEMVQGASSAAGEDLESKYGSGGGSDIDDELSKLMGKKKDQGQA